MNNIIAVMKKEFARFFGDKRMVAMTLLPAVMIYVIYSFMGVAMQNMFTVDEYRVTRIYAVNMPEEIDRRIYPSFYTWHIQGGENEVENQIEEIKERIRASDADLLMVFPDDFIALIHEFDVQTATEPAPNIEMFFNSIEPNSRDSYQQIVFILDEFEESLANKFDINRGIANADLATAADVSATIISSIMPLLLLIFLFSGCMALAPESIAGEKERGTLATLLVTPLGRSELAAGKILSLAVLSFLSGLVTALATILALPNMMGAASEELFDVGIYSMVDYILLAFVILSTVLLFVAIISIVSAFARTVKEASTAVMPLMILVMLAGVTGMFGGVETGAVFYMIPIYNSVQSMNGIFSMNYSAVNVVISCISNLAYACIGGLILTKMFNNEKVMFSK